MGNGSCGFKCCKSWCSSVDVQNVPSGFVRFKSYFGSVQLCVNCGWVGEFFFARTPYPSCPILYILRSCGWIRRVCWKWESKCYSIWKQAINNLPLSPIVCHLFAKLLTVLYINGIVVPFLDYQGPKEPKSFSLRENHGVSLVLNVYPLVNLPNLHYSYYYMENHNA